MISCNKQSHFDYQVYSKKVSTMLDFIQKEKIINQLHWRKNNEIEAFKDELVICVYGGTEELNGYFTVIGVNYLKEQLI